MAQASQLAERPTRVRWGVFCLMGLTSWFLYLHRYVFSYLKPTLADEWGLSNQELGEIDSAFSIAYGLFQFPLAILADVFGVHLLLPCLMIIWFGGLALMCRADTKFSMQLAMLTLGGGQSAVYACLNRVGRMWYPLPVRTTMQSLVAILAGRLGNLSSAVVFSSLLLGILQLNWPTAVGWLIGAGFGLLLLIAVCFRNSPREHPWVNEAEARLIAGPESVSEAAAEKPSPVTVKSLLQSTSPRGLRNLAMLMVQSFLSTVTDTLFSNWIPKFLADVHHLKFTEMGFYASLPLLGGAIAGLVGGSLNDYLIARTGNRRWPRVAVAFIGKGLAAILLLSALLVYQQPYWFCICLFFVKFFGDWSLATAWGVFSDIGGRATASVFALNNAIATIGLFIAPPLVGRIADTYGWPAVFVTISITCALCACSWLGIDSTIPVLNENRKPPAV